MSKAKGKANAKQPKESKIDLRANLNEPESPTKMREMRPAPEWEFPK